MLRHRVVKFIWQILPSESVRPPSRCCRPGPMPLAASFVGPVRQDHELASTGG
jgi:hypothetical protein